LKFLHLFKIRLELEPRNRGFLWMLMTQYNTIKTGYYSKKRLDRYPRNI